MVAFVIAVFMFAGMVKGMIGLGLPALSMGLLTLVMTPFQAASLLVIPSMLTNFWQLFAEGGVIQLIRRFWTLLLAMVIGSTWSIFPTLDQTDFPSEILLGGMLLCYGLYGLWAKKLPDLSPYEKWLSPIVGYLGGAVGVATGVVLIPIVPYIQSLQLKRDDLVQSLGLAFTVATVCLAVFLYKNPVEQQTLNFSMAWLGLVPALIGMGIGAKIRYRVSEQKFRKLFFFGLCSLGSYMLIHSLG